MSAMTTLPPVSLSLGGPWLSVAKLITTYATAQILDAILPEDLLDESPSSYTQVGHIGLARFLPKTS